MLDNDEKAYKRAMAAHFAQEDREHRAAVARGEIVPVMMCSEHFTAVVDVGGARWRVSIYKGSDGNPISPPIARHYPTRKRRDNGALDVSRQLRREFGITGTYSTY